MMPLDSGYGKNGVVTYFKAPLEGERKHSRAEVSNVEEIPIMGRPYSARIRSSTVERQNLSVRMGTRRFTRVRDLLVALWP
jgi:hypothetical protein